VVNAAGAPPEPEFIVANPANGVEAFNDHNVTVNTSTHVVVKVIPVPSNVPTALLSKFWPPSVWLNTPH
jgi:hypothetical protein